MDSAVAMRAFARVVERGSFSAAADDLGLTPSAVSKLITRLEDRLGVRLLHRTTRRLSLTPEGETYHLRARDILTAIADADAEVSRAGQTPRGRLRVNCITAFALHQLVPALPEFITRCPEVKIELVVSDRVIDLLAENADIAIRTGLVADPSLVARKIADVARGLYASPAYLERRGVPNNPDQLRDHDCIVLSLIPSSHHWQFRDRGEVKGFDIVIRVLVDSAEAALRLAIAGGGIARVGEVLVRDAIREGRLVPVLADCYIAERTPLSVVYPLGRHRIPKFGRLSTFWSNGSRMLRGAMLLRRTARSKRAIGSPSRVESAAMTSAAPMPRPSRCSSPAA
jgi:DNA-binding transcriptional LysR family regulator